MEYETLINLVLWSGAVSFATYNVVKTKSVFKKYDDVYNDFKQGWLVQTEKKDIADYEWQISLEVLSQIIPWLIIHIVVSEYLRKTHTKILPHFQLGVSLTFVVYSTGIICAFLMIAQPLLFRSFQKVTKNTLSVWICSGFCLGTIWYLKTHNTIDAFNKIIQLNEMQLYTLIITGSWINLRCISYFIDNKNETGHDLLKILSYCFYLPTVIFGPFITCSSFEKSQERDKMTNFYVRLKVLLWSLVRFGFWLVFTEFSLHFVYINALSYQPKIVSFLSNWSLYGYGYCMGQFFHLKYVVLYGLSTSLAKFEHISTPATPKCIGRIHLYSDMWKYFDEGLYNFLLRYIYFPTVGPSIWRKMISSLLCFSFVFVWHGVYKHVLIWAALNFFGIFLEKMFSMVYNNTELKNVRVSSKWKQRFSCVLAAPLLAISAISNFYFFAGTEIGNIFFQRILDSSLFANLILLGFLYSCCYVSTEVKKFECLRNKNYNIS